MGRKRKLENYYLERELPDLKLVAGERVETTPSSRLISDNFERVLDSLPFYVLLVDSKHRIHFANKAIRHSLGLTLDEITGCYCPKVVHQMDSPYPGCPVEDVIKGKQMQEKEYYSPELGRWLLTTAYPTGVKTADGGDIYYHTVRDITEAKEAEQAIEESEQKYRRLFEEIQEVVFIMTPDGNMLDLNRAGLDLLGLSSRLSIPRFNLYRDLKPQDATWASFRNALVKDGQATDCEYTFSRMDGQIKANSDLMVLSVSATAERDEGGNLFIIRGTMSDRTHEKLHTEAKQRVGILESATRRFSALTQKAITEKHWEVGFEDEYIPTCWEVKDCSKTDCPVYGKEHLRCWLIAGTYCRGEVQGRFARKIQDCAKCDVYKTALAHNPVSEIVENFNNLMWALREKEDQLQQANIELESQYQELDELHRKAKERANIDGLTGLKNHGHFQHTLQGELERSERYEHQLSLVMIDLDKFKQVNDSFGHQKGDAVLVAVGSLLKREIRRTDYVARYGGEEFVVVMPEISGEEAAQFSERLRVKFEQLYKGLDLPEGQTSASFGIADYPACATEKTKLISAADSALLLAKRQGRNRVLYYGDLSEPEQELSS